MSESMVELAEQQHALLLEQRCLLGGLRGRCFALTRFGRHPRTLLLLGRCLADLARLLDDSTRLIFVGGEVIGVPACRDLDQLGDDCLLLANQ